MLVSLRPPGQQRLVTCTRVLGLSVSFIMVIANNANASPFQFQMVSHCLAMPLGSSSRLQRMACLTLRFSFLPSLRFLHTWEPETRPPERYSAGSKTWRLSPVSWHGLALALPTSASTKASKRRASTVPAYRMLRNYSLSRVGMWPSHVPSSVSWVSLSITCESLHIAHIFLLQFSGFGVFLRGGWATDQFVTNYLPLILFPLLYIGSLLYFRCKPVKPMDMDFISNIKEIEADTYDEPPPRNWFERFWAWLVSTITCVIFQSRLTSL